MRNDATRAATALQYARVSPGFRLFEEARRALIASGKLRAIPGASPEETALRDRLARIVGDYGSDLVRELNSK